MEKLEDYNLFKNKLSEIESLGIINVMTDKEIKEAMFDIGEAKAPGLDGFTSEFFKSTWSVIGMDVCVLLSKNYLDLENFLGKSMLLLW